MGKQFQQWLILAAIAALLTGYASAQDEHLRKLPGYVEFDDLTDAYGEATVEINIGGDLLKMIQSASQDDPDGDALKGLDGVRINVYATHGDLAVAAAKMNELKARLEADDWEPFVREKTEKETVNMFIKVDGEGLQGMVIMVVNLEEAVFINLLGNVDPDELDNVMDSFGVEVGRTTQRYD